MASISINGAAIKDWDSFHTESQKAFGFPEFYGRNMDAWVDCLSYLRDEDGMSTIQLQQDETLQIELTNADVMRKNAPDILEEMGFCIEGVNERYEDYGEKPALVLVLR